MNRCSVDDSTCRLSPEQLLELAQRGDQAALGSLLSMYRRYLALLARAQINRRLQGKVDASDLAQETLLEAHRHFGIFRGTSEAAFAAWLRNILAGLVANHVRRFLGTQCRDARLERSLAVEIDNTSCAIGRGVAAAIPTPSEQAVKREASRLLADALELLPEHYRQVILLRHIDELSFAEVAAQMGRSVDSVEKLWVRALGRLRKSLGAGR
ncbi:MAG: sigma-70 family RNA polymerase sigma factor [Pirellulales bacterium]|nr:sigma-70 family RNA polymerase sigma factor [Pirellulales bacterium]